MQGDKQNDSPDSGDDVDPLAYLVGLAVLIGIYIASWLDASPLKILLLMIVTVCVLAIIYCLIEEYGEEVLRKAVSTLWVLLLTKRTNLKYRSRNPWRQPFREAATEWLVSYAEKMVNIGHLVWNAVRSHPVTPFERPTDRSSGKQYTERTDDE